MRNATPGCSRESASTISGTSPAQNLYLNVGHGALGWTLALASGRIAADAIARRRSEIPLAGLGYRD